MFSNIDHTILSLTVPIHIIISFFILHFLGMLKWAFFEVLLSPVLSDSFGMTLGFSSYFYLGLAGPRILGAILV